jgi:hypothetical protein
MQGTQLLETNNTTISINFPQSHLATSKTNHPHIIIPRIFYDKKNRSFVV